MIELRDVSETDVEQLFLWRREPEVDRWMGGLPPSTWEGHLRWWDGFRGDPDRLGWIITRLGRPAGLLTLTGVSGPHRRAQWGWYIGDPEARGRGAGRAAQALGLDRAFDELGLEKVWSEVFADNDTALKAQAAAGFRREGYMRRHYLKDGRYRDCVLLAILADEWREKRAGVVRNLTSSHLIAA
jgi:UDP-4-amino-4,6-dideoxy-N-acetyl-beta-L-altrosamine N-acetyltransferase